MWPIGRGFYQHVGEVSVRKKTTLPKNLEYILSITALRSLTLPECHKAFYKTDKSDYVNLLVISLFSTCEQMSG